MSFTLTQNEIDEICTEIVSTTMIRNCKVYAIRETDSDGVTLKAQLRNTVSASYVNKGTIIGDSADVWHIISTGKSLDTNENLISLESTILPHYTHDGNDAAIPEVDSATWDPDLTSFLATELYLNHTDSWNCGLIQTFLHQYGDSGVSQHPELSVMYSTNNSRGFYVWNDDSDKWDSIGAVDVELKSYLADPTGPIEEPVIDSDYIVTSANGNQDRVIPTVSIGDFVPSADSDSADSDSADSA